MKFKQNKLEHVSSTLVVTKGKKLPHGQFEAILSNEDKDRHGEIVSMKGMTIPKDQTIKMYYNHLTNGTSLPIGKWLSIKKSGNQLIGVGEIDQEDEFAVKVYKKILKGYLDSISIGFYPLEFDGNSSTWTKSVLVEGSVVAEPANVNAIITSKDLGITDAAFDKFITEKSADEDIPEPDEVTEIPDEDTSEDGASNTEVKAALTELKSRIGAVEETLKVSTENPTIKTLIHVRVAGKQVDKAAEQLNRVIKLTLKG